MKIQWTGRGSLLTERTEFVQGVYSLRQSTRFRSGCEIWGEWKWEQGQAGLGPRSQARKFPSPPPNPSNFCLIPTPAISCNFFSLQCLVPVFANHRLQLSTLRKSLALACTGFGALRFNSKNIKRKNCYLPCYIMFSVNYHLMQSLAI